MTATVPVYSIAKTYTAAAVWLCLDLRDQIGSHVPSLPSALASLSIRDLLMHRSGLDDYGGWEDYHAAVKARQDPWPIDAVLERAVVRTPGEFRYSNIGYLLLRLALEQRHGDSFFGVLDTLVLGPLAVDAAPFATRSDWSSCTHPSVSEELRRYHPGWVYTGTFAATVDDAARGIALIMRGELGRDLAEAMQQTSPVDAPGHPLSPAGYGLGLMAGGVPPTIVGHGGGGPGFSLFAASTARGERWHGEVAADEESSLGVAQRCVDALAAAGD